MKDITIGKLSDHTGVKIETIRYYEKIGLMPAPPRTPSGHRVYDNAQAKRLKFIRRGRELGFSITDIRSLLGLEDHPPSCADVHALTECHLKAVHSKINDLKKLAHTLTAAAKECDRGADPNCPIIDTLSSTI